MYCSRSFINKDADSCGLFTPGYNQNIHMTPFTGMAIIELNDWIHGCAYQAMKYNASVQEDMSIGGIINVHLMSAN